jgi:Flp pilus assembly protein TadD
MPASAIEPLRKASQLAPTNSTSYFYLGVSLLALDRDEEAKNAFRRMAALSPGDADQLFVLQKGYSRLAAALLERMTEMTPDSARVHQLRAELLDLDHQSDRALEEYKQAVAKNPNAAALHYALGCAYWARFRPAEAKPELESVIRIDPTHYMARYKLGLALTELDRPLDAIQQFKKSLELQPGLANAQLGLAKAYAHSGDSSAALAATGECLKLDPKNQSARYLRAQILRKLGRQGESDEQLKGLRTLRDKAEENHP